LLAHGGLAARVHQGDEVYARLMELSLRCLEEEDAAQALVQLLSEQRERLLAHAILPPENLAEIHAAARTLPLCALPEGARALSDTAAWELAELAADAYPDRQAGSEMFAEVAVDRSQAAREKGDLEAAHKALERALAREPAPGLRLTRLEMEQVELERMQRNFEKALERLASAQEHLLSYDAWIEAAAEPLRTQLEEERDGTELDCVLLRGRLQLELGRINRAWEAIQAATALVEHDLAELRPYVLTEKVVFLVATERAEEALEVLRELRADERLPPSLEGPLLVQQGFANQLLELSAGKAAGRAGEAELGAALAHPLSQAERVICNLQLAQSALLRGALDEARTRLTALDELLAAGAEPLPTPEQAQLECLRAWAARLGGASTAELERRRDALERAQAALLERWSELPPQDDGVGFLHFAAESAPLGELIALDLVLDGPERGAERALVRLALAQSQGTLARRLGVGACTAEALHAAIGPQGLLLAYCFAPQGSWLLVADDANTRAHPLESRWTLLPSMRRLTEAVKLSPQGLEGTLAQRRAQDMTLAGELRPRLLPDEVARRARAAAHVTVVGEDMLGAFAFEALELEPGISLGTTLALDHGLSLPIFAALAARRAARPVRAEGPVHALLAPAHDPRFGPPLRFGSRERAEFERAWPGISLWTGGDATVARLEGLPLGQARALLCLAHGHSEPSRALPAGIVLAPTKGNDGVLWCEDVAGLTAPPLVVLAVCGAGEGHERRGEDGATHFGGALLRAGTQCVVASPFTLEERSTLDAMLELGRGLARGASVAEAMRDARRAVSARFSDPFYHELWQVLGTGR
jgi:CHAT domain-containing protein